MDNMVACALKPSKTIPNSIYPKRHHGVAFSCRKFHLLKSDTYRMFFVESQIKPRINWIAVLAFLCLVGCSPSAVFPDQTAPPTETLKPTPTKEPSDIPSDTPLPTSTQTPTPSLTPSQTLIPTATPKPGATLVSPVDKMPMVYVPAGEFEMGGGKWVSSYSVHTVFVDDFYMDKYEVTNAQYKKCVEAGECIPPWLTSAGYHDEYYKNPEFDPYPVIQINWYDAQTYCEWSGKRLPTEAEWEKAARGSEEWIYPWGNEFDGTKGNFCGRECREDHSRNPRFTDGYPETSPVGSFPDGQSPYGAMDMAGNVKEWVSDWYDVYPGGDPDLGSQSQYYGQEHKVVRGGSWNYNELWQTTFVRVSLDPFKDNHDLGFRCAQSAP